MKRTQVYLPEQLYQDIDVLAHKRKKPKAEMIRTLLQVGLSVVRKGKKENAGDALIELSQMGVEGPRDLSVNLDKHLYEEWQNG